MVILYNRKCLDLFALYIPFSGIHREYQMIAEHVLLLPRIRREILLELGHVLVYCLVDVEGERLRGKA